MIMFTKNHNLRRRIAGSLLLGISLAFGVPVTLYANSCPIDVGGAHRYYGGYYNAPELPNPSVFVAIQDDGTIKSWGEATNGGENEPTDSGYVSVSSNWFAFAAVKVDGSITAWGVPSAGGTGAPNGSGFNKIASNVRAFAALNNDGSISSWGDLRYGGGSSPAGNDYASITANGVAFAALTNTGVVRTWGEAVSGVLGTPSAENFVAVAASAGAFAALGDDGTIISWGDRDKGGFGAPTGTGYLRIFSTTTAFAAVHEDGSIFSWGDIDNGGVGAPVEGTYIAIASTDNAFAALHSNGRIYAWGAEVDGGAAAPSGSGYVSIISNQRAFAARHVDGSVVSWGDPASGGGGSPTETDFVYVTSNHSNFAALTLDGSIHTWGSGVSSAVVGKAQSEYVDIASIGLAFAALDTEGAVFTWGLIDQGGVDSPESANTVSIFAYAQQRPKVSCVPSRNRTPTIVGTPVLAVNAHSQYVFTTTAFDPDGSDLVFGLSNNPSWLSVDAQTGVVSGMPADADIGTAMNISVSATDIGGKRAVLPSFDITVEQITEKNLVVTLLQSEEFLVEQLTNSGINGAIAERSLEYSLAFSEAPVAQTTLLELQLIVETVNSLPIGAGDETTANDSLANSPEPIAVSEGLTTPAIRVGSAGSGAPGLLLMLSLGLYLRRQPLRVTSIK